MISSSEIDLPIAELVSRAGAGFGGSPNNEKFQAILSARLNRDLRDSLCQLSTELTEQTKSTSDLVVSMATLVQVMQVQAAESGELTRQMLVENKKMRNVSFWMTVFTALMTIATIIMAVENFVLK